MPPAHNGIDGTSESPSSKISRRSSSYTKSRKQRRRATLSEQDSWANPLRSSKKTSAEPCIERLTKIVVLTHKIGILYDEAVKVLNTYHSVATAQRMISKLETYSQALIRLQEQALQLTKGFERWMNRMLTNHNLEAIAKQLYDYWFVQFDFPNTEGKPYKSSSGKMVWNEKLKREIPEEWHCGNLFEIATFTNGLACQKFRPKDDEVPLPVIKIREMHDGISSDTEEVSPNIPELVKVYNGDVLFSWSASLEVMLWACGLGGLNQHIFKVTSANDFPKSFYYFQLLNYVDVFKKMAEARKTTMGHITQDHLQQSTIAIPDNKDIVDKFEKRISPIFAQMVKLQEEIQQLSKQRDELLPLLMNGQVSVNYDLSNG